MRVFKSFLSFFLTLLLCVNVLCGCGGAPVSPGTESDSSDSTENTPATDGITDDVTDEDGKLPDGTKTHFLIGFSGDAGAVLTAKNGKYTEAVIIYFDGSIIAEFNVEYAEDSEADGYYAKLECALSEDYAPEPEIAKAVLEVDEKGNLIGEAYYAEDGSPIVEFTIESEYGENGEIIKSSYCQGDSKMMELEYASSASGEIYPKLVTSFFDGGYNVIENNEEGMLLRYLTYENGVLVSRQENTYDDSGRLIGTVNFKGDKMTMRWEYSYEGDKTYSTVELFLDDKVLLEKHVNNVQYYTAQQRLDGSKIRENLYKEDPNRTKTVNGKEVPYFYLDTKIEYDEAGKKTRETVYYYKDLQAEDGSVASKQHYYIRYRYDENGQTVHEFKYENVYDSKGVLVLVNQYNDGELTLIQVFGADGRMQFASRYSNDKITEQELYEYDENGKRSIKETRLDNFLEIPKVD